MDNDLLKDLCWRQAEKWYHDVVYGREIGYANTTIIDDLRRDLEDLILKILDEEMRDGDY